MVMRRIKPTHRDMYIRQGPMCTHDEEFKIHQTTWSHTNGTRGMVCIFRMYLVQRSPIHA